MSCPKFRELCLAVAITYFHFVRPFLIAVGTETSDGFKQLSHAELCKFYPALISSLKFTSDGHVEQIMSSTPLPYLSDYQKLSKVAHKGHREIFTSLFLELQEELETSTGNLSLSAIMSSVQLIAAGYAATFCEQTDRFYGEKGLITTMLRNDPTCLDGVTNNALGAERQVGEFRASSKRAPTAKIFSHGISQIVASAPYMQVQVKGDRKELEKLHESLRSPKFKYAMRLLDHEKNVLIAQRKDNILASQEKRDFKRLIG